MVLEVRNPKWLSLSCDASGDSSVQSNFLNSPASKGHLHFLLHGSFLSLQSKQHSIFKSLLFVSYDFLPPSFTLKTLSEAHSTNLA